MISNLICGSDFSFSICYDKTVYCMGYNNYNLGFDKTKEFIYPPQQNTFLQNIKMIQCGISHTIALNYEGEVFSFGLNNDGVLGIGYPKELFEYSFTPQKLNLSTIYQISCGDNFTICLSFDGFLYSFGVNNLGQLGLGNNNNFLVPTQIPNLFDIDNIICSSVSTICNTISGEYYTWGGNYNCQLGIGINNSCNKPIRCNNWPNNIISIKSGGDHSLLLTTEGQVYSFGYNGYGQLGINDENIRSINKPTLIEDIPEIQRIECGINHSMCIDINNNFWLFGSNYYGQLGLGDTENRYKPILHPILSDIIDISSGGNHTFVKTIENKIYAFGYNNKSQLGIKQSECIKSPIYCFENNETIWRSNTSNRVKSARK